MRQELAKKLLVSVIALVLLTGGAVLVGIVFSKPRAPTRPPGDESIRGPQGKPSVPPVLVGRSPNPGASRGSVLDAVPPTTRVHPKKPSAAVDHMKLGDDMYALLADIRRDVAPEWWGGYPDLAALEGRNGVVIARAPPDVLDAIMRYLDLRRKGDPIEVEDPPQLDARALDAARAALRPVLRGIIGREHRIGLAIEAWEEGHLAEARALADEVLAEESDNEFAKAIREGVSLSEGGGDAAPSTVERRGRVRQRLEILRRQQTLRNWAMLWPSARTWSVITSLRKQADLPAFHRLAPDLDELLDRGSVTIEVADESLYDVIRRLQIETLADIRLSKSAWDRLARLQVAGLREEARSLRAILDELVRRLPEDWTWYAARSHVVITRIDSEVPPAPETYVRYFDTKDMLVPGSVPLESSPAPEPGTPPVPPVYRRDPNGGPPVLVEDRQSGERTPR